MEKIYVEQEQQQRQQQRKRKLNSLNISLGLSFAVAFIAIASILFVSLSGTSYALDEDEIVDDIVVESRPTSWVVPNATTISDHNFAPVFLGKSGGNTLDLYCLESKETFTVTTLKRKEAINDDGLIYLTKAMSDLDVSDASIKRWLTQTAIWAYLAKIGDSGSAEVDTADAYLTGLKAVQQVCVNNDSSTISGNTACNGQTLLPATADGSLYTKYGVDTIIAKAIEYNGGSSSPLALTVNKAGTTFTLTDDDKYYKSPKITVSLAGDQTALNSLDNFTLGLNGAPEGSVIQGIDSEGKATTIESSDELTLSSYKEFYVIVPKDKITEQNKKFSVSVNGSFKVVGGYYYRADGAQSVTTLKTVPYDVPTSLDLEVVYKPKVPDTAMNASQSIYLIGLIVLLSGLGILYVNVRKQQKQN